MAMEILAAMDSQRDFHNMEFSFVFPQPMESFPQLRHWVELIEDRLKLTVNKIVGIKDGPKIREAYGLLDDWYRDTSKESKKREQGEEKEQGFV